MTTLSSRPQFLRGFFLGLISLFHHWAQMLSSFLFYQRNKTFLINLAAVLSTFTLNKSVWFSSWLTRNIGLYWWKVSGTSYSFITRRSWREKRKNQNHVIAVELSSETPELVVHGRTMVHGQSETSILYHIVQMNQSSALKPKMLTS